MTSTKKGNKIECTIWSGAMRGIRVGTPSNYDHFDSDYPNILIEVEGEVGMAQLSSTFWGRCPEIRVIKNLDGENILSAWIRKHGLLPPSTSLEQKGAKDIVILEVLEPYQKYKLYRKKPEADSCE